MKIIRNEFVLVHEIIHCYFRGEHWGGKYCSFEDNSKLLDVMLDVVPDSIIVTVRVPKIFTT